MRSKSEQHAAPGQDNAHEDEDSVWSSMLRSVVHTNSGRKMAAGRSILVMGPPESGKTTLIAKLQGLDAPKKGSGLEYGHIEIRDEERDDSTQLGIYTLDGDPAHSHLLQFALSPRTLPSTLALLTVSYAEPWAIMDQLQRWVGVLHDHIDNLKMDPDYVKELRSASVRRWLEYSEPGSDDQLVQGDPASEEIISLPEGTLARNLGMELVVVVTKTDSLPSLDSTLHYTDEHHDFIQHRLRQFCLQYGAALFYTSVKEEKNCDLLYKYLVHRLYGGAFRTPALVVERDAVFIPAGWDNGGKVGILEEGMTAVKVGDYYGEVIRAPGEEAGRRSTPRAATLDPLEALLDVEEEQRFLERQLAILQNKSPAHARSPRPQTSTPKKEPPSTTSTPTATPGSQERVLANFFNSLLSKRSPNTSTKSNADDSRSEVAAELDSMLNKSSMGHSDC